MSHKKYVKWNTSDGHSPLVSYLNSVAALSKEVVELVDENTFPLSVGKGKLLLKPVSISDHLYFIVKGIIQAFIKEEAKPITTWINSENEIVGSIRTLGTDKPCGEYLQALEETQLVAIPFAFMEFVFNNYPETNVIGRSLWLQNYKGAEERAYICRITTAEKKYKRFLETHPDLINRVSLKHIASFLGMTQETLSRVRNRKKVIA